MVSIENKMASATKWSSLAEAASKFISPIVNMVLARILSPAHFGIVATINIVITFAEVFQDAGFQKYLIQHEFTSEKEYDESANVAFWTNFGLSFFIWIIICIFRQHISVLVNNTGDLGFEIAIASISLPIFAFSSIQIAICKRNFNFKKLFWVRLITSAIPLIITVPLAFVMRSHWALIIGTIARNIAQSIVLLKGSWKPKLCYSFKKLQEMLSFCIWTLIESITIWLTANAATFIVTRTMGVDGVGLFKTSMNTVTGITGIISAATLSVLFTSLSRVQNDNDKFNKLFYDYQRIVGLFVIPLGTGVLLYRELLTEIMLGRQWMACADFVGGYAFVCAIAIVTNLFFSEYYRAKGKPRVSTLAQVIYLCVMIPAVYISSHFGFTTLSVVTCILVLIFGLIHFVIFKLYFDMNIIDVLKNLMWIAVPTFVMSLFALITKSLYVHILWQITTVVLCVIIYFAMVLTIKTTRIWLRENDLTSGIYKKLKRIINK